MLVKLESLFHFIQLNFPWLIEYKYVFLFLGSLIEGFNTLIFGGFLASLKAVRFLPLWILMIIAHSLSGYFWYFIGYSGGAAALDKWGHKRKLSHEFLKNLSDYFHTYSGRAIFFAKLTWGLQIAMLILAGSFKYNLKNFSKYNFMGSFIWVSLTMGLGYVFGQSLLSLVTLRFHYLVIFLAAAIALTILVTTFLRGAFIKSINIQEKLEKIKNNLKERLEKIHKTEEDTP